MNGGQPVDDHVVENGLREVSCDVLIDQVGDHDLRVPSDHDRGHVLDAGLLDQFFSVDVLSLMDDLEDAISELFIH